MAIPSTKVSSKIRESLHEKKPNMKKNKLRLVCKMLNAVLTSPLQKKICIYEVVSSLSVNRKFTLKEKGGCVWRLACTCGGMWNERNGPKKCLALFFPPCYIERPVFLGWKMRNFPAAWHPHLLKVSAMLSLTPWELCKPLSIGVILSLARTRDREGHYDQYLRVSSSFIQWWQNRR